MNTAIASPDAGGLTETAAAWNGHLFFGDLHPAPAGHALRWQRP